MVLVFHDHLPSTLRQEKISRYISPSIPDPSGKNPPPRWTHHWFSMEPSPASLEPGAEEGGMMASLDTYWWEVPSHVCLITSCNITYVYTYVYIYIICICFYASNMVYRVNIISLFNSHHFDMWTSPYIHPGFPEVLLGIIISLIVNCTLAGSSEGGHSVRCDRLTNLDVIMFSSTCLISFWN